jgi:hypothetical protein
MQLFIKIILFQKNPLYTPWHDDMHTPALSLNTNFIYKIVI